jgi:uncharacterized protein
MSGENAEVLRRVYDGWARGDFRPSVELFDPYVVLVLRPEFPDARAYLGPQEIARYMRHLLDSWEDFTIEAEELIEAGDSVVVQVRQRGLGVTSGAVTELGYFQVWTFRGDRVIRLESVRERRGAFEAVGLRQQP